MNLIIKQIVIFVIVEILMLHFINYLELVQNVQQLQV